MNKNENGLTNMTLMHRTSLTGGFWQFTNKMPIKNAGTFMTTEPKIYLTQEYVLWNAVSVPLLQFAPYCCRDVKP